MALFVKDRVKETTTTTGTGSVTLGGAATGFQTFNSAIGVGNTTYYCIAGQGTSEWEVGVGTLSASTTLARTTVLSSSNSGSLVTFSAGTKDVFVTYPSALAANISNKNALINGDFQIWQEGTSFAAMATSTYMADNWKYQKAGAMVHTGSRSTDVPTIAQAGRKIGYSILIDCTTVDSAIAAGDFASIQTYVEGYNLVNIAGVGLCCQFWHKHTKTGTYCVAFTNGSDRSFVREYTQAVTDTWEFASVLVDATPSAGTWNYTNEAGIQVFFTIAAGTDFQGTAGTWNSAVDIATSNQVNACDNVANNFMLAGVQLEKGSVATEFDVRPIQAEIQLCQRYYEKSYSQGTVAGSLDYSGAMVEFVTAGSQAWMQGFFRTVKRAPPTVTLYSGTTGASGFVHHVTVGDLAASTTNVADTAFQIAFNPASGNALIQAHWVANARF